MMLDLEPHSVTAPGRMDLARVEAMMLWPDDEEARQRWLRAAILQAGAERIDEMPVDLLRQFAKDSLTIPRLAELRAGAGKRDVHGAIAGMIVLEASVFATVAPDKAALEKVRASIAQRLKGTFQIEPRTMNNKTGPLYRFRAVAHLWAAWCHAGYHGDMTLPCRVAALPTFLATAEAIRRLAEVSRAPKGNSTVMRPGEAVELPGEVLRLLPVVDLDITPARSPEITH